MVRATPLPPDERRAALVAATEPLLEQHGRDVSTRQIAEAAGVAEGTIFRVFPTKEALIDAVIEEAFDVQRTCDAVDAIDPEWPLEARVGAAVTQLQDRLRRVLALFHGLRLPGPPQRGDPSAMHARQRRDNEQLNASLTAMLQPDAERLRVSTEDAAAVLRALTFALSHPMFADGTLHDPSRIVDLVLHGVAGPPAGARTPCPPAAPALAPAPTSEEPRC